MELVPKVVCALGAPVPIIDRKEGTARPQVNLLEFRLNYVQNYADPVFVVISDHALMCVGRVRNYDAIFLGSILSWVILLLEFLNLLVFHLHVLLPLLNCHFHASVVDDRPLVCIIIFDRVLFKDGNFVKLLFFYQLREVVDSLGRSFIQSICVRRLGE